MAEFKDRLKELREEKGLSQRDFAKLISFSPGAIGMWETGERAPNHETTKFLAKFFDTSADFLLGLTDIKKAHVDDAAANRIPPDLSPETYDIIQEAVQYALRKHGKSETVTDANPDKSS